MKRLARYFVVAILGWQVRRLRKKHQFSVVAVAGSVGKTTTKHATASYLSGAQRVQYQEGNYNVPVTVPLVFFDEEIPSLLNPFAWLKLFLRNESKIKDFYPYDIVVVELGIDTVGDMDQFARYVHPDVGVLTSIAPEHMENFDSMDQVAAEELKLAAFCDKLVVGIDDIPTAYQGDLAGAVTYGLSPDAEYRLIAHDQNLTIKHGPETIKTTTRFVGAHVQKSLAAAVAVADVLGVVVNNPSLQLAKIAPMPGRMQLLVGKNESTIIDDTYNNVSQVPLMAALDVLYSSHAVSRIAVLGNMNELGRFSRDAHVQVGEYCDPKKLDLVITIGPDANKYLASAAEQAGCVVERFDSPYDIGEYLQPWLKKGTTLLIKGSQNRVFLEEAIKPLLADPSDRTHLVRQSKTWLAKKAKQFEGTS